MTGVLMVLMILGGCVSAVLAALAVLLGDATSGMALAGLACFAALLARIAQAGDHHEQQVKRWWQASQQQP